MSWNELLGFFCALFVGFNLGLMGGGGSVLTIPVLVYLLGVSPLLATSYSLFVVGTSAAVGAYRYIRMGLMNYRIAILFAIPSFFAIFIMRKFLLPAVPSDLFSFDEHDLTTDILFILSLIGTFILTIVLLLRLQEQERKIARILAILLPASIMIYVMREWVIPAFPIRFVIDDIVISRDFIIMIIFAVVVLVISYRMIRDKKIEESTDTVNIHEISIISIGLQGAFVGALSGIIGAGGGFLIVPALVLMARLPMKLAVGTSLLIVSTNALIGFMGDMGNQDIDWSFLSTFASLSMLGIFIGSRLSAYISAKVLKLVFGWFMLAIGITILSVELYGFFY